MLLNSFEGGLRAPDCSRCAPSPLTVLCAFGAAVGRVGAVVSRAHSESFPLHEISLRFHFAPAQLPLRDLSDVLPLCVAQSALPQSSVLFIIAFV